MEENRSRKKEIEYKQDTGTLVIPQCRYLKDLLREYIDLYGRDTWALSTYESNVAIVNNYILPLIGDTKLADINTRYFTISGEYTKYVDDKARYGVGLEVHVPEDLLQVARFDLRVGYYTRDNTGINTEDSWVKKVGLEETSRVSFGVGVYSSELFGYGASIDYAVTPFGALGTSQQLALSIQF